MDDIGALRHVCAGYEPIQMHRAGIDIGGTPGSRPDDEEGSVHAEKLLTTPTTSTRSPSGSRPAQCWSGTGDVDIIVHGTTVATNAILEAKGSHRAHHDGGADVLELRRLRIPEMYRTGPSRRRWCPGGCGAKRARSPRGDVRLPSTSVGRRRLRTAGGGKRSRGRDAIPLPNPARTRSADIAREVQPTSLSLVPATSCRKFANTNALRQRSLTHIWDQFSRGISSHCNGT